LITEIKIDSESLYPNQIIGENDKMKLVLNHNHKLLSIRFTALEFSFTGIKNFRYKLDGINDDWVYLQNEQMASFTHLHPGNYTFTVETQQKNHEWTGDNTTIEILVKKPFWLTIPFFIFVVLILAGILYLTVRIRSRTLLLRQKELEKIIQESTDELLQKNQELETANQTKNKFFSIISHDLRSPFSGVLGILDMLNDSEYKLEEKTQKQLLKSAKVSANNTFELMENLLTWARSQMIKSDCNPRINNLSELLRKSMELKKVAAEQKEITLIAKFPEKLEAYFDSDMIDTVVRNILSNAVKFSEYGGKIEVLAEAQKEVVIVHIADSGIGLKEEETRKLFEINKETRRGTGGEKGTGLGLIISKEFIEKNFGRIWATPNSPKGTVFHFTIPVKK